MNWGLIRVPEGQRLEPEIREEVAPVAPPAHIDPQTAKASTSATRPSTSYLQTQASHEELRAKIKEVRERLERVEQRNEHLVQKNLRFTHGFIHMIRSAFSCISPEAGDKIVLEE